ncbi:VOC family protein [Pelomonas puraquae]|uniref:Glyoxalase n=2 Tax=Roseateles puraquae TaxID=431059 RepID=A0A254N7A2_9BURK|nr:VOC family protein [Roseateles puraquae]OWR03434.1 glyoxalase [Roseateles puraquae]
MPAPLRHFAINAADVDRAKAFYEAVFGWRIEPWGPPDFYQVKDAGQGLLGALQARREIVAGKPMFGFEASFGVEDLQATIQAIMTAGGRIVMQPYRIDGVGELIFFEDTEGNLAGAMQYVPGFFD